MIIQHNIAGMNTSRNYGVNSSKLEKSIERLSSGYKINRSGDDAAGLSVSEKMRAQISGMKQAIKNCEDGVSLIQTFEGALDETVTIIKRLRNLAVQSANGTYDEEIDRSAIEIEFRMLCDEVDQLADTDFNGLVMLNGGHMADGFTLPGADPSVSNSGTQLFMPDSISYDKYSANFNDVNTKMSISFLPGIAGMKIDRETYDLMKNLDLSDLEVRLNGGLPEFSLGGGYQGVSIRNDPNDVYSAILSVHKENGDTLDVARLNLPIYHNAFVQAYGAEVTNHDVRHPAYNDGNYFGCSIDIKIYPETDPAKAFDMVASCCKDDGKSIYYTTLGDGNLIDPRNGKNITYDDIYKEFKILPDDPKGIIKGSEFRVEGEINFNASLNGANVNIADPGHELAKYAYVNGTRQGGNNGQNVVTLTFDGTNWIDNATSAPVTALDSFTASQPVPPANGDTLVLSTRIARVQEFHGKYVDSTKRNTGFDLNEPDVDYSKAKDGDVYYFDGKDWTIFGTNQTVKLENVGVNYSDEQIRKYFEGLKIVVTNNTNYCDNGTISASAHLFDFFDSKYSVPNAFHVPYEGLTFTDHLVLQANSRSKDSVNFTFRYSAMALGGLNADLNCSCEGLGLDRLSASTQKEANKAIDQCSYALNKVLMIRSTFGAAQNRLESKVNTLSNAVINITDAESRIRDANMADEMIEFTKNQLVTQGSQTMLAQANALPQQVMQILGS